MSALLRKQFASFSLAGALQILLASAAFADAPVVEKVEAQATTQAWRFDVTLSHPDTGWDHYADGWRIELPDGTVLGTRVLAHPHVNEQPFTRSLSGVTLPAGTKTVVIRARCNQDGWSETGLSFDIP